MDRIKEKRVFHLFFSILLILFILSNLLSLFVS